MRALLVSLLSGVVFALGLGISGMTQPSKIVGFLDFAGNWDPSLALVMVGAIAVYYIVFRIATKWPSPLLAPAFEIPKRRDIDGRLVVGSALFGVGWGLGGFCPGPAIAALAWMAPPVVIFVVAMCAGMYLHGLATGVIASRARSAITPTAALPDS
jgi:uncharacterized protein